MGFIGMLWLPILLASVVVFIASSLIHMVINWHKSDFKRLPNEDAAMTAVRALNIPPGDYMMPMCDNMKDMKSPEFLKKWEVGPVGMMTIIKPGPMTMAPSLVQWFIFIVFVNIFAAYIASHAVPWGGPYLEVFRFVGCSAFMAYSFAMIPTSIWFHRDWGATVKSVIDGLIYALLSAGVFGWLWPKLIDIRINL